MRPKRWLPRVVGAAVLVLALAVALLPSGSPAPAAADGRPASIPARLAGYSYLTGDVSSSPPGRAVALFQHGFGVEFMDFPQAVVVGADGDVYRRVDVAEDRAGDETQGDPAPMLLSPDGTRVAVGDYDMSEPDIALLDLDTGDVELHPVPGGHSAIPLAWSPDSARLAYLTTAEPVNPHLGEALTGDVGLLEAGTGEARTLPDVSGVRAAAFSPDGTELALHGRLPSGGGFTGIPQVGGGVVQVVGLDGAVHRQLKLPPGQYLDGPNAWSPDGTLLATGSQSWECDWTTGRGAEWDDSEWLACLEETDTTFFVDASGGGGPVAAPLKAGLVGSHGVLGWTGAGEVLVLDDIEDPDDAEADGELYWLTAVPIDGGEPRRLSAVPGGGNYGIGNFHLAAGLLPDLQVREAGGADRGRWPTALRLGAALLAGGAALAAAHLLMRRRSA